MTDPSDSVIEPDLRDRLETAPAELQSVSVWFTELPADEVLARSGLAVTGINPAMGMVDAATAYALAERPDVVRIVLQPEPQLT
ncbi:MAG: hypothetical protein ABWX96_17335 [Propionibacteriaceae bacterium]